MPSIDYRFTTWDDPANGWEFNPGNMVDLNLGNFASTDTDDEVERLLASEAAGVDLGTITAVEIGCYSYGDGGDEIHMVPWFGGAIEGTSYVHVPGNGIGNVAWEFSSIYADAAGPGAGGWDWADIQNLDVYMDYQKDGKANLMYSAEVRIRVTYSEKSPMHGFVNYQLPGIL